MNDQSNPADFDQLLPVNDVAKRLAVSVPTVWRLSKSGDIPKPIHIGRSARWRASDLQKHLATQQ
jgi:excisionase family DNA binding protein